MKQTSDDTMFTVLLATVLLVTALIFGAGWLQWINARDEQTLMMIQCGAGNSRERASECAKDLRLQSTP